MSKIPLAMHEPPLSEPASSFSSPTTHKLPVDANRASAGILRSPTNNRKGVAVAPVDLTLCDDDYWSLVKDRATD